jgi:hypothetical protein
VSADRRRLEDLWSRADDLTAAEEAELLDALNADPSLRDACTNSSAAPIHARVSSRAVVPWNLTSSCHARAIFSRRARSGPSPRTTSTESAPRRSLAT